MCARVTQLRRVLKTTRLFKQTVMSEESSVLLKSVVGMGGRKKEALAGFK